MKTPTFALHLLLPGGVEYTLAGAVDFERKRSHFTARVTVGNQAYRYDDMLDNGTLFSIGALDQLQAWSEDEQYLVYVRQSSATVSLLCKL